MVSTVEDLRNTEIHLPFKFVNGYFINQPLLLRVNCYDINCRRFQKYRNSIDKFLKLARNSVFPQNIEFPMNHCFCLLIGFTNNCDKT